MALRDGLRNAKRLYTMVMILITLFVLFFATWIALFLAKQISIPITALLDAASEVRKGNLEHRVEVRAVDELALLVRGFNQMTQELEANSRELDLRRRFTEAILESIPTGVISIGADGSIQRVNRALAKIFPAAALASATRLEDLFSREDTAEIKYLMKRARRTGMRLPPARAAHGNAQAAPGRHRFGARGEADLRLRGRARRHQRTAARPEGRGLARGGAARGARNQEPAHAHRAFRRTHRPPAGSRCSCRPPPTASCASAPPPFRNPWNR